MVRLARTWLYELKRTFLAMIASGTTKYERKAWTELDSEFITRAHRVRLMRRTMGMVLALTVVSAIMSLNSAQDANGYLNVFTTIIVGIALSIFVWRLTLNSARNLAHIRQMDMQAAAPDDIIDLGDINDPAVIFAPWIPNSRKRLKDVLSPFSTKRKK